jgi:hypothetical protein
MAETRKLAAILAADVVGYSKLAGADEERPDLPGFTIPGHATCSVQKKRQKMLANRPSLRNLIDGAYRWVRDSRPDTL